MTDLRTAAQQALEALEWVYGGVWAVCAYFEGSMLRKRSRE